MKHKISILFHLNSSKASKKGLYPIYLRITINGVRIELSTSKFVEKSKWNTSAGKIKGTNEEARLINSHLDILKSKVYETENWMINNNQDINTQTFKNKFLGVEEKQRQLTLIFDDHNKRMKELIGSTFANNTFKKYETTLSHTKEFLKFQYNLNDISIKRVDIAFINDFDFFLRNTKKCNNNSTIKYIRNFVKIVTDEIVNWVIGTFPSKKIDIDDYQSIKEYLASFGKTINQTGEKGSRKKTSHKWFETQDNIAFWQDFEKPKLVWKRIGSILRFCYDETGAYCLDCTCIATGPKVKFLTAVLNSKFCNKELFRLSPKTGAGDLIISVQALNPLRIPFPTESQEKEICNKLDLIISLKKGNPSADTTSLEREIDLMVYELYGLSEEEIGIVENS